MKNEIAKILIEDVLKLENRRIKSEFIETLIEFIAEDSPCALVYNDDSLTILREYKTDINRTKISLDKGVYIDRFITNEGFSIVSNLSECKYIDEVSLHSGIPKKRLQHDEDILEFLPDSYIERLTTLSHELQPIIEFVEEYDIIENYRPNNSISENLKVLREYNLG